MGDVRSVMCDTTHTEDVAGRVQGTREKANPKHSILNKFKCPKFK
jgi:hypothetical protein